MCNSDLFGCFSGDEFIVVLCDFVDLEDVGYVVCKLIVLLVELLYCGEIMLKVGVSVGIVMFDDGCCDFDLLLCVVDVVMYVVKEVGCNMY